MRKVIILFAVVLFGFDVSAQVGGLSNSKLGALSVDVVGHHKVEFEPAFFHVVSKKAWNSEGNLDQIYGSADSAIHSTGLNFRITYGLWDKLEIGASLSTDLQMSNWGLRYILFSEKKIGVAVIAGANIPFKNKVVDKSIRIADNMTSLGGGAVMSMQFSENLSLDFNAQYMTFTKKVNDHLGGSYYFNADLGYYLFNHQLQLVGGLGYQGSSFDNFTSNVLTVYPGFTIETGNNYVIVLYAPFDIYGRNATKNSAIILALSLTIN